MANTQLHLWCITESFLDLFWRSPLLFLPLTLWCREKSYRICRNQGQSCLWASKEYGTAQCSPHNRGSICNNEFQDKKDQDFKVTEVQKEEKKILYINCRVRNNFSLARHTSTMYCSTPWAAGTTAWAEPEHEACCKTRSSLQDAEQPAVTCWDGANCWKGFGKLLCV